MAAGLGVLARLTQQVSQNRVQEQNFRSGLAQQSRNNIARNRQLRLQEQSDLAARNDRDLDRDQRDRRAAESIEQQDKAQAAANERARIAAASRGRSTTLPVGSSPPSDALFPGGQNRLPRNFDPNDARGFDPDNPNARSRGTDFISQANANQFESDKLPKDWTPNSPEDNKSLANAMSKQAAKARVLQGDVDARSQQKASTVDARKSQELTDLNSSIESLNSRDEKTIAALEADNILLEGRGKFKPASKSASAGTLTNSQRIQLRTGLDSLEEGDDTMQFVDGTGIKRFIPRSTAEDLLTEDRKARGVNEAQAENDPGFVEPKPGNVKAPGIPANDPTGIRAVSDPKNPPGETLKSDQSNNKKNEILRKLKPKTSFFDNMNRSFIQSTVPRALFAAAGQQQDQSVRDSLIRSATRIKEGDFDINS